MSTTRNSSSRRLNGLEPPYHPLQIVTWFLFPVLLLHFYACLVPLLWDSTYLPIIVIYAVLSFIAGISAFITCYIDPADDAICEIHTHDRNETNQRTGQGRASIYTPEQSIYCHLCETRVHNSSKHCTHCRKCVKKFDHHCKWLNSCIGEKNYRYFLMIISSVSLITSFSLAISIAYTIESFALIDNIRDRIEHGHHRNGYALTLQGTRGVSIVASVLLLPLVLLVYQLAGFHIMLLYRGLTTYDFIVLEQKKQREKARRPVPGSNNGNGNGNVTNSRNPQQPQPKPQQQVQIVSLSQHSMSNESAVGFQSIPQTNRDAEKLEEKELQEVILDDENDSEVYDSENLDTDFAKGSMSEMTSLVVVIEKSASLDASQPI